MRLMSKLCGVAGLVAMLGSAQGATVLCPNALNPPSLTRQVQVTGALDGGECYYKTGNFQGDDVGAYLGYPYYLLDKDIAPNGNGEDDLSYTQEPGGISGTWAMNSNLWLSYDEIFIAFHFGNGSGDPDSFIVELDPGDRSAGTNGDWDLIPTTVANGLSNIYLFARGPRTTDDDTTDDDEVVPEPATLALVGMGLLAAAAARRRRKD